MERLNITLGKNERVQPYSCTEIIPKSESCCVSDFSSCGEYLAVGCHSGQILIYSFLTHSIIWRHKPSKIGKILRLKWISQKIYVLTDANTFYTLNIQGPEEDHINFFFKVTGMDIKGDYILIYGRCDTVLHNRSSSSTVSVKQDQGASEWFSCFCSEGMVLFASPTNAFYLVSLSGELLYKQDVNCFFQAAVRELVSNGSSLFLLSSRDRALRVFELKRPYEFVRSKEIFECIEKKRWAASCFFTVPNMEAWFVLACPHETGSHSLQMFDTVEFETNVSLAKNMHSPLGAAAYICCSRNTHVYPVVAVNTGAGAVLIWCSGNLLMSHKWSTSLGIPNFVELRRGNIEYDEPEDQFDKVANFDLRLEVEDSEDRLCFRLEYQG